jgi:hypothetical protein
MTGYDFHREARLTSITFGSSLPPTMLTLLTV